MNFGRGAFRLYVVFSVLVTLAVIVATFVEVRKSAVNDWIRANSRTVWLEGVRIERVPMAVSDDHPALAQQALNASSRAYGRVDWAGVHETPVLVIEPLEWALLTGGACALLLAGVGLIIRWIWRGFVSERA